MSYGVIVGRFQVNALHDGHRDLFDQVAARHPSVIVFVGVNPQGLSKDHPLNFEAREKMIKAEFPDFTVLPLDDMRTDDEWSAQLDTEIGKVVKGIRPVTLYGGRDSFVPHYTGKHKPVELALDPRKHAISGTDIRRQFSEKVIQSNDFRAGMIYAMAQNYPVPLTCVDIAALYQSENALEVLVVKRSYESKWRFPGGHAELKGDSFEEDARRELYEETHSNVGGLTYVGSCAINDWRCSATPDRKIRTILYRGFASSLSATPGDDIAGGQVRWVDITKLKGSDFMPEHVVLFNLLYLELREKGYIKHADTVSA